MYIPVRLWGAWRRGFATRFCQEESPLVRKLARDVEHGNSVWRNCPFVKPSIFLPQKEVLQNGTGEAPGSPPDETDIIHIYQIRGALEGLAAGIVAERKLPLQILSLPGATFRWRSRATTRSRR
jgi:hypothetical protein